MPTLVCSRLFMWPCNLQVMFEARKEAASMKITGWFRGEKDRQFLRHLGRNAVVIQALGRRYLTRVFFIHFEAMTYQKRRERMQEEEVEMRAYSQDLVELSNLHVAVQAAVEQAQNAAMRDEDVCLFARVVSWLRFLNSLCLCAGVLSTSRSILEAGGTGKAKQSGHDSCRNGSVQVPQGCGDGSVR